MSPEAASTTALSRGASSQDLARLVEQAQQGKREALEELYLLHFDRIYSYLHMNVGNRHDAEDLTTQVFVKMLESIGKFRWRSAPFSAWLFRIAHNLAMDHFRASRRWQPEEEVPEPLDEAEPSAEASALQTIGRESMLELIQKLSHEQQQVLTLKFVFNFSNAEAATILGKTEVEGFHVSAGWGTYGFKAAPIVGKTLAELIATDEVPELIESFGWVDKDPTVYHTMNGPSEFHVIGSIKDWQVKDRLGEIDVPTLLTSGRYDEATPALQETLRDGIPNSEWVLFEESSHTPFSEERERYMQVVGAWLARHD